MQLKDYVKIKIKNIEFELSKLKELPSQIIKSIDQKLNYLNTVEIVEGVAQLSTDKYQYFSATYNGTITIQLPEDDSFNTEIRLFIETGSPLKIYQKSISSTNTWNSSGGWSSQYIKVTPGTSINFTPETITTANIELLKYYDMDNVRRGQINKNATQTIENTINYVKINCWDANQQIPEYIYINGEKYNLAITTVEADAATEYIAMADVIFPNNCVYPDEIILKEDAVQEFLFTKKDDEWICQEITDDSDIHPTIKEYVDENSGLPLLSSICMKNEDGSLYKQGVYYCLDFDLIPKDVTKTYYDDISTSLGVLYSCYLSLYKDESLLSKAWLSLRSVYPLVSVGYRTGSQLLSLTNSFQNVTYDLGADTRTLDETYSITSKALTSSVLTKTNTTEYTPTADYHPATKKYVDDKFAGLQIAQMTLAEYNALETKDPNTLYIIIG